MIYAVRTIGGWCVVSSSDRMDTTFVGPEARGSIVGKFEKASELEENERQENEMSWKLLDLLNQPKVGGMIQPKNIGTGESGQPLTVLKMSMMPPMIQPRHLGMGHDVQVLHNSDSVIESDFGDLAFELLVSGPEDGSYTMIITHQECNAVLSGPYLDSNGSLDWITIHEIPKTQWLVQE